MAVGEGGRDNGVQDLIKTTNALGSTTIDLSRKNLTEIPSEVLDLQQLEFLYVEGNYLTVIPEYLFERLPNLKWLDLRNNHITEVPATVGSHKSLRNLLLEGNDIKELPLELGFAKLSGLNLASNPLEMPPSSVIEKGTQEVLKYLRDKYATKMQLSENQGALGVRSMSPSSSDDDLLYGNDYQVAVILPDEEKVPLKEDGVKIERVRLPPIFQAAAERPRIRTVDETNEILRGQKSTQFEPKSKTNIQISEPELRLKSPKRQIHDIPRAMMYSPPKDGVISPDEGNSRQYLHSTKRKNYSDSALRNRFELIQEVEEKPNKPPKRRKPRRQSPTKTFSHSNKSTTIDKEGLKEITIKTNDMKVSGGNTVKDSDKHQPNQSEKKVHYEDLKETTKFSDHPFTLSLNEGDYVAIKVPSKLYIKGQPCLGKITTTSDNLGLLTVHYYIGTYEGYWRPMMSRTSPYLRKVPHASVLCKFRLSDGRMSPITRAKVKNMVDGEEQQHVDLHH